MIGAFNCQGAGWDPQERRIKGFSECYKPVTGSVHVTQIEWDQINTRTSNEIDKAEEFVVYLSQAKTLLFATRKSEPIHVTIGPSSFEIFSFVPVKNLGHGVKFAPIGITNMLNAGGTVQELDYGVNVQLSSRLRVKGRGDLLVYSSVPPKSIVCNGVADVNFDWSSDGKLTLFLPWVEHYLGVSDLVFTF